MNKLEVPKLVSDLTVYSGKGLLNKASILCVCVTTIPSGS